MKVLVTNNTLNGVGGSETYAYTLIKELNRREGITAHAYTPQIGQIGNMLKMEGVQVISNPIDMYDAVFCSHTSTMSKISNFKGIKIQTCHGVYPALEQPSNIADKHVSISKEVQDHLTKLGYPSTIIHNGVDCNRFKPVTLPNDKVKTILSLTQSDELNQLLQRVCTKMGIKLIKLNKFINPVWNVEEHINQADMVIGIGRGCYEAMACGREVLVLDKRPYVSHKGFIGDGLVTLGTINDIISHNCSGRHSNIKFNYQSIKEAIEDYNPIQGKLNRDYALEHFNIEKQVNKYLELWK